MKREFSTKLIAFVITVIIVVVIFGVEILYFKTIYNSDLPTWLKWLLLKG